MQKLLTPKLGTLLKKAKYLSKVIEPIKIQDTKLLGFGTEIMCFVSCNWLLSGNTLEGKIS